MSPKWLLILSFIAILTHPSLDWLNNYGVRLLMPVSDRWFYGDAVFIVDPWLWGILAAGVMLASAGPISRFVDRHPTEKATS